jgi:DNA-binding CsgD family transcriptional regulator
VLIALLKVIEYQHFIRVYPTEIYGGIIAVLFTVIGIYAGLRLTRHKEVVVVREVRVREGGPFLLNEEKLKELGITPREHEILGLIAEGLSNREIGERLFVSENTVKTHSSRLFDKMGVNRRVQAMQKGKELGLIP